MGEPVLSHEKARREDGLRGSADGEWRRAHIGTRVDFEVLPQPGEVQKPVPCRCHRQTATSTNTPNYYWLNDRAISCWLHDHKWFRSRFSAGSETSVPEDGAVVVTVSIGPLRGIKLVGA
jgi:hypothetical protein